jgi:hypothetical protein
MTQTAVPEADVTVTGWTASAGGNLFGTVDEAVTDDADYLSSAEGPQDSPVVLRLSDLAVPSVRTGHTLTVRARGVNGLPTVTIQLRQGYVSEASQGTLIASTTPTVTSSFANYTLNLTTPEATAISDYTALFVRIVADT